MTDSTVHARHDAGSPWAAGASLFAAAVMIIIGFLQFFQGLVVIINGNDFLLTTPNYVFEFNSDAWGWAHLIIGAIVALAGLFILMGSPVARGIGIVLASLSAIANFLWIPYYPFWGIVLVALNILVIWGLSTSNLSKM